MHPSGSRTYASLLLMPASVAPAPTLGGGQSADLLLFAGAHCVGSCKCFGDVSRFNVSSRTWTEISVPEGTLIGRYKQGTVAYRGALYTFGGESYSPYMYHNSVQRLPLFPAAHARGPSDGWASLFSPALVVLGLVVAFAVLLSVRTMGRAASPPRLHLTKKGH